MAASVFKVKVKYQDDAHEEQVIAVARSPKIRTAQDAVAHCLRVLHHKDPDTLEIYPAVSAEAVREEPFPISEAPRVVSVQQAMQAAEAAQNAPASA